ncbi:hypothetical protein BYT27DRAFT_7203401 [Phlegmacium glaucopus]|nr:hypothetical protein BYT27DRAFT_7203401 [Phlegmacium glaucopus]
MPITLSQKAAIEEIIQALLNTTSIRSKRPVKLASMFMDLVDRTEWPAYYDVIPEPRCLKNIQAGVEKGRYREASDVYADLSLVFWNALFYNEPDSQIALDAGSLKTLLEAEWKKRSILPHPRGSPPPSSAQKVHGAAAESSSSASKDGQPSKAVAPLPAAPTIPTRTITMPAGQVLDTSSTIPSDPDVDIVTPDSEGPEDDGLAGVQTDRDPQSDEIIKQLEKGLPSWPGFGEEGWMGEVKLERLSDIVHLIKSHKDIIGNRLAVCLESIPEEPSPALHLSSTTSISLKQIETRSRHKLYKSAKDFDTDMAHIFEKARKWHDPGTEAYGMTLLLQRFYQSITSPNPPPGPPYVSTTNFASLPAGPGTVKPFPASSSSSTAALTSTTTTSAATDEHQGGGVSNVNATTYRVPPTRDRTFVDEVNYKGWKLKLGDWVHLSNPDDPSKPIVGQVFKCWTSESDDLVVKKGRYGITVSWYYRPEQTFHPSNRQFWEGEVFKTLHFADHPIEDLIEKVACQFTDQHIRGRPRPPFWYPGFPLYVCESEYNDLERVFVRIRNWNGCIPEEVRQEGGEEFMPIYRFEKTIWPKRVGSPFLVGRVGIMKGMKGPGGIVANVPSGGGVDSAGGDGESVRKKLRSDGNPSRGQPQQQPQPQPQPPPPAAPPPQTPHTVLSQNPYQQFQPYMQHVVHQPQTQRLPTTTLGHDRSVVTAAGGIAAIGGPGQVEKLPAETAKLFDRDPVTNEVLWFAAPPMNMPRDRGPRYSLEYLTFIATKRKRREGASSNGAREGEEGEGDEDEWEGSGVDAKRTRTVIPPTVTEILRDVWKEMEADGVHIGE